MNPLAAMCWLSREATEGIEIRANRVRSARGGEELTGCKADFSFPMYFERRLSVRSGWCEGFPNSYPDPMVTLFRPREEFTRPVHAGQR